MSSHASGGTEGVLSAHQTRDRSHMCGRRPPTTFILAFLCVLIMVSCKEFSKELMKDKKFIDKLFKGSMVYTRHYKFYNHCSERQIEIIGNSVSAMGRPDSPNADLIVRTTHYQNHFDGIHIIGKKSGRYLCFNKKSKLITRFSGVSPRCIFEEHFSPDKMHSIFKSIYNPEWHIGFNTRGKPIPGYEYNNGHHKNRCYYFTKRGHDYLNAHKHRHHIKIGYDYAMYILNQTVRKKRQTLESS